MYDIDWFAALPFYKGMMHEKRERLLRNLGDGP